MLDGLDSLIYLRSQGTRSISAGSGSRSASTTTVTAPTPARRTPAPVSQPLAAAAGASLLRELPFVVGWRAGCWCTPAEFAARFEIAEPIGALSGSRARAGPSSVARALY